MFVGVGVGSFVAPLGGKRCHGRRRKTGDNQHGDESFHDASFFESVHPLSTAII
jgi:hypothetical protein